MSESQLINSASEDSPLILIIEDDVQIRRLLRSVLTNSEYRFMEVTTAREALRLIGLQSPDLLLLDLGLPDIDGMDVIHQLREWTTIPILVLTARDREEDMVTALDAGADDYLTKPFNSGELLARMRVALRHAQNAISGNEQSIFRVDKLSIDLAHRRVSVAESQVHLSPIEYKLLQVLVRYAGKVVTQHQLLRQVWGPDYLNEVHYLRIYMGNLRRKLEEDPARPRYLLTEPGVGYRLQTE